MLIENKMRKKEQNCADLGLQYSNLEVTSKDKYSKKDLFLMRILY